MRPTSNDLRLRIVAARTDDGQSMGEIARRYRIPKGTVQPRPWRPGRKPAFAPDEQRRLAAEVERRSDATLAELRARIGKRVSLVCIHRTLYKLGFTRKKSRYVRMSSAART